MRTSPTAGRAARRRPAIPPCHRIRRAVGRSGGRAVRLHHASKWALEGLNQTLAQEVEGFGIKVTPIEPAGYATDWGGKSAVRAREIPAYEPVREKRREMTRSRKQGDPHATAAAILQIVDSADPPLRFLLGSVGLPLIKKDYEKRLAEWEGWSALSSASE